MIDPLLINTIRVGQLVDAVFSGTDNIPHEVGTDLRRGTINELATFISGIIQAGDGLAFLPISVTDGQTLQNTTTNEWFLAGVGTYHQNGGYPDIVCTEKLNVIIGNGIYWSLGVAIPIIVDPPAAMISQSINQGVLNFAPSEDAVFNALSSIRPFEFIDYPLITVAGTQTFELPIGAVAKQVFNNKIQHFKESINNSLQVDTWTQTGNIVTLKKNTVIGNYISIFYQ